MRYINLRFTYLLTYLLEGTSRTKKRGLGFDALSSTVWPPFTCNLHVCSLCNNYVGTWQTQKTGFSSQHNFCDTKSTLTELLLLVCLCDQSLALALDSSMLAQNPSLHIKRVTTLPFNCKYWYPAYRPKYFGDWSRALSSMYVMVSDEVGDSATPSISCDRMKRATAPSLKSSNKLRPPQPPASDSVPSTPSQTLYRPPLRRSTAVDTFQPANDRRGRIYK